jgi:hypothetical protein
VKVAVIGSRSFNDYERLSEVLSLFPVSVVVSGGADGADTMGERYADENNLKKDIYLAQWDLFGKKAGFLRNTTIVENCDMVIAFWDSKSKGTRDSIGKANKLRKNTFIVYF